MDTWPGNDPLDRSVRRPIESLAVDGDRFPGLRDDMHFEVLLVQTGDQLHRGSAIVLLRMRDGHDPCFLKAADSD